ncbi:Crp/Fnr family transcriptional regulator [Listeria grandensis]|uniref:Crp/Fnr family transcriptional regulator n=1 Tax=Listeria grandensis TaxID=1494963 RepID=UPI00164EBB32|nr:Crp/Fnr family transcriptional regulator [Listeria grandensis]MBC6315254.1 Crp/Fnr family transcriptional regulator [Listeria grandensis]
MQTNKRNQSGHLLAALLETNIPRQKMILQKNDKIELISINKEPYIFIIVSGVVAISSNTNTMIDFAGEGDLLDYNAYSSYLSGKVLTDKVSVWRFAQMDIFTQIAQSPVIQMEHYHMLQMIQRRLEQKQIHATLDTKNKIAAFIHTLAARYNTTVNNQGMLELPKCFSRKMIANYAGVSLSTLTTYLQQLVAEDRIVFNKHVIFISENNGVL